MYMLESKFNPKPETLNAVLVYARFRVYGLGLRLGFRV